MAVAGDRTVALQQAIDVAAVTGVPLELGPGEHLSGALRLPSGLDLRLGEGAVLRFVSGYESYLANHVEVTAEDSNAAMILATGASGIRIGGPGRIEAPGPDFITGRLDDMGTHVPAKLRPRVLVMQACTDVVLEGFSIHTSPMWTIHLVDCRRVRVEGVSVDNDREMPNTDGIVIDSCEDVLVRGCTIATADDGVVLKTSQRPDGGALGRCRNIAVENSSIESRSCALKIGTETHGDIENVRFVDCEVKRSNRAIGIFSRDGGHVRNVVFRRMRVEARETPDGFWGSGEAITVNIVDRRRASRPAGRVEAIVFEDIEGSMEGAVNLVADGRAGIGNVRLTRVSIHQVDGPLRGHRYDMRPTHFDLAPSPDAAGRANAWVKDADGKVIGLVPYPGGMPALFSSNVEGIVLEEVSFDRPSPLPAGWNADAIIIRKNEPSVWS
ncbi:glycoside hydrolase family 28 protein [Ciceribacter ferrooxidans]|uniref:Glycoside hydrolase family 28 protein n=1 Tax=Ciceribacter ferrooxidans TaxID=2509717 RepID=A0A4Q2TUD7_9HYPH|nr:glycoside hydrolase family 28 protein [Ciceribacter ferrooxidans]RYC24035.1 glycoside hydrolase family 28 protein [Ciceribacter ferrooxidans]